MKYNNLTGTSLQVSQLSLGTMMFGGQTNEADSLFIMDEAYDRGINLFDTADAYNAGDSERVVGKWLKHRRDKVILATKVFNRMGDNPNDAGLSRYHIIAGAEASLRRLDTDHVDIYYMHAPDYRTSLDESLEAMTSLVKAGKVRYLGISNYAAWQMSDILALCDRRNHIGPIITQNVYNLITRGIETELVPFLAAHPMAMTAYNPIAAGLLAGKHQPGKPREDTRFANNEIYYHRYWSEENFHAVALLTSIASSQGLSILELAMKWCVQQPYVTTVITGVSRLSQLQQNVASVEGDPLSENTRSQCDAVWHNLTGNRFGYNR